MEYLIALAFAALPAIANFLGGWLAEFLPTSKRLLGLALHSAAGVLLAIISVELMPRVMAAQPPWVSVLAFTVGGIFFTLTERLFKGVQHRLGVTRGKHKPWIIFFSMAIHLLSGGLMIGTSATIARNLSFLLGLGRFIAHLPQGFATIAEFKQHRISRRTRFFIMASFIIPVWLGATMGYWLVRDRSQLVKLAVLAFTTGALTTALVEEIIPEAHQNRDTHLSTLVFISSFALFTLLLTYF